MNLKKFGKDLYDKSNTLLFNDKILLLTSCLLAVMMFVSFSLDLERPFWLDEIVGLQQSRSSNFLLDLAKETHPPIFYLIMNWSELFLPDTEKGLRLLPLAFSFLTTLALFGICHRQLKVPPIAALLFLTCPMTIFQSQNLRPYTLLALISIGVCFYSARVLFGRKEQTTVALIICTLLSLIGLLTHYLFVFLPAGIFCAGLLTARIARTKLLFYSFVVTGVLFLAIGGSLFLRQTGIEGAYYPGKTGFIATLKEGSSFLPAGKGQYVFLLLLGIAFFRRGSITKGINAAVDSPLPIFYLSTGVIGLLLPIAFWPVKPVLVMKAVMILFPPICLGIGFYLVRYLSRLELLLGMFLMVVASFFCVVRNPLTNRLPPTLEILGIVNKFADTSPIVACELSFATAEYYIDKLYPHLISQLTPLPKVVADHPGWPPSAAEVASGRFNDEISLLANNKRLLVLFSEKDLLCNQLRSLFNENDFKEEELFSGYGDRFEKVLIFTKRT